MKRMQDSMVRCPYYKGEEKQKLFCEGVRAGSTIHMAFDTDPHRKEYECQYCKRDWKECPVAQMLNKKYDYE